MLAASSAIGLVPAGVSVMHRVLSSGENPILFGWKDSTRLLELRRSQAESGMMRFSTMARYRPCGLDKSRLESIY